MKCDCGAASVASSQHSDWCSIQAKNELANIVVESFGNLKPRIGFTSICSEPHTPPTDFLYWDSSNNKLGSTMAGRIEAASYLVDAGVINTQDVQELLKFEPYKAETCRDCGGNSRVSAYGHRKTCYDHEDYCCWKGNEELWEQWNEDNWLDVNGCRVYTKTPVKELLRTSSGYIFNFENGISVSLSNVLLLVDKGVVLWV